ncbi:MAG: FAD-binding oxidoreductase [Deltaproteobacteria bacterium]|nr:FAD-binding oxidoreductase [Deltaproteobacteria bacterium]
MAKERFVQLLGNDGVSDSAPDLERYGRDWSKEFPGQASLVLFPRTAEQVRQIVLECNNSKIPLVPSGGRSGLSGGATAINGEVILSLERLNKILEIDLIARTATCEAGVVTQKLQEAVREKDLYFPIDFASTGSSQIGGNIATNAGGIHVVRYGNIRDWVLGLKVVTGSGDLLDLNGKLVKNQTGYDLRSLFIGSEGTLGVIVEATLKLSGKPSECIRALCGVASLEAALAIMAPLNGAFPTLSAFEYFDRDSLELVCVRHKLKRPLGEPYDHYVMIEVEEDAEDCRERLLAHLAATMESGDVLNALVAAGPGQGDEILRYRELIPETISADYFPHKNDVSVPVSMTAQFIAELKTLLTKEYPEFKTVVFGHLGDGNMHINILKPDNIERQDFNEYCKKADVRVFELVSRFGGSISAEHGVGLLKKPFLGMSRSASEIEAMRGIKRIFDPAGIMNPGKIFDLR